MKNKLNHATAILSEIEKHSEDTRGLFRALLIILPNGQRSLLDALASHKEPVVARDLAHELEMTVHVASSLALRLKALGLVEVERKGRDSFYKLSQKFHELTNHE